jgi:protocatechuate 3,4-dioxygenase beta subunit
MLTPGTTEGPYYKANSSEIANLRKTGIPGEQLTLNGRVFDTSGNPVSGAWLDFWQADGNGNYDNVGFTLRGHQFSDNSGQYKVETVVPGGYSGRTPHIHVKIRSPDGRSTLTTQLFIPGLASNKTDSIYCEDLQMDISDIRGVKSATFNFVINSL